MCKHDKREKFCKMCYNCRMDCKKKEEITQCKNFEKGLSSKEYWKLIKQENINLKRLCNDNQLSLNTIYKMLNNKMHWTYKYRYFLEKRLFINEQYEEYYDRFEKEA